MTKDGTAEFIAVDARAAAIFDLIYPIGSVFATTGNAPARGTWEEIAKGRTLQGADANHAAGSTVEAGLPNIEGKAMIRTGIKEGGETIAEYQKGALNGVIRENGNTVWWSGLAAAENTSKYPLDSLYFDASKSNPIYGASDTVQPPAYVVHFYRRTA